MMSEKIDQLLAQADSAIDAGDMGRATNCYQQVLVSDPDNYEACLMMGSLLGESGQLDLAITLLRKAEKGKPGDATACMTLAHILRALGKTDDAISSLEEAIRREPLSCDTICTLGSMLAESGRASEAIEQFNKAVEIDPSRGDAWSALGALRIKQNDAEGAAEALKKAIQVNPADREAPLQLGIAMTHMKMFDDADSILRQALADHADYPELHFWLAYTLEQRGRYADALEANATAQALAPGNSRYLVQAAAITEAKGDTDEAFNLLRPVLESNDVPVQAALLFARMSHPLGMKDDARYLLSKVAEKGASAEHRGKIDEMLAWLNTV
jgi:tetratricopeptide (TPR) repeat protein